MVDLSLFAILVVRDVHGEELPQPLQWLDWACSLREQEG